MLKPTNEAGTKPNATPATTPLSEQAQRFLQQYGQVVERPTYVSNHQSRPTDAPVSEEYRWRIHIAIEPTPANLALAAQTLARAFNDLTIDYQLIKLPIVQENKADLTLWDLTNAQAPQLQRSGAGPGQELVIFMSQNSNTNQFSHTPEQYKAIILNCLSALKNAHVKFGYTCAPVFDQYVPCDNFLPQMVSFRPPLPFNQRHPWLKRNTHQPNSSPLKGVIIKKNDLFTRNLDLEEQDTQRELWLTAHVQQASTKLKEWFNAPSISIPETHPKKSQLKILQNKIPLFKKNKKQDTHRNSIRDNMPLDPHNRYEPFLEDGMLESSANDLNSNLDELNQFVNTEPKAIFNDFQNHAYAMRFIQDRLEDHKRQLKSKKITHPKAYLEALIQSNMNHMQLLFVRLSQIHHENTELSHLISRRKLRSIEATLDEQTRAKIPSTKLTIAVHTLNYQLQQIPQQSRNPELEAKIFTELEIAVRNRTQKNAANNKVKLQSLIDELANKGSDWKKVLGVILVLSGLLFVTGTSLAAGNTLGVINVGTEIAAAYSTVGVCAGVAQIAVGIGFFAKGLESRTHKDAQNAVNLATTPAVPVL